VTGPANTLPRWSRRQAVGSLVGLAGAAAGLATAEAQVKEIEGFRFDSTLRLGGADLVLNGVGVRRRFFVPVYVAALYVPARSSDAETLLSQRGPRRMSMKFVREVEAELFMTSLDVGMRKHYTPEQLAGWKDQWQTLTRVISTMVLARRADNVTWDYTPDEGARVMQNSVARVPSMRGEDFYNAVLRVWLGPQPADADLKKGLLGT
jgi:hypothetical protein